MVLRRRDLCRPYLENRPDGPINRDSVIIRTTSQHRIKGMGGIIELLPRSETIKAKLGATKKS